MNNNRQRQPIALIALTSLLAVWHVVMFNA